MEGGGKGEEGGGRGQEGHFLTPQVWVPEGREGGKGVADGGGGGEQWEEDDPGWSRGERQHMHMTEVLMSPPSTHALPVMQVFAANLRAMQEMRRSRVFRRCLRAALDAGNFLNFGRWERWWKGGGLTAGSLERRCIRGAGPGNFLQLLALPRPTPTHGAPILTAAGWALPPQEPTHPSSPPLPSPSLCSRLGSAVGFRLKNLPKLADSKAADGKTTLLQVCVSMGAVCVGGGAKGLMAGRKSTQLQVGVLCVCVCVWGGGPPCPSSPPPVPSRLVACALSNTSPISPLIAGGGCRGDEGG